ncbi:MAG: hypothetical protein U9R34_02720 [Nanoarchaeota archaeon]|nr:hypothetical protein [Nanoarchaeota archaeon]
MIKESAWLKAVFIIAVAANLLLLCGCAAKQIEDTGTTEGIDEASGDTEIADEVPEGEYEISTEDIEYDLDLSELEGIDEELEEISW